MKAVTDFQDFGGAKGMSPDDEPQRVGSPGESSKDGGAGGVTSKMSKDKKTPTPVGKKSPAAAVGTGGGGETPSSQPFPEADPNDPNKHKVTPDCASIDMT